MSWVLGGLIGLVIGVYLGLWAVKWAAPDLVEHYLRRHK